MAEHPVSQPPMPTMLTVAEVAAVLRVSERTVRREVKQGRIPHRTVGRQIRFERGAFLTWARGDTPPPTPTTLTSRPRRLPGRAKQARRRPEHGWIEGIGRRSG